MKKWIIEWISIQQCDPYFTGVVMCSRFDVNKICVVVVKPLKIVWKRVYTTYRDERSHLDRNQWSTSVVGLYHNLSPNLFSEM